MKAYVIELQEELRKCQQDAIAIQADNERLRGLLREVRERMMEAETTASVLTGQLPQYSEGQQMLSRLATIMGDSAKQIRAALGTQADQPSVARSLTLTGAALLELVDFCDSERDSELTITEREPFVCPEDGPMPAGLYAHFTDYPEEGWIGPLGVTWPPPPVIKGPGRVTAEEAMQPFGKTDQPTVRVE